MGTCLTLMLAETQVAKQHQKLSELQYINIYSIWQMPLFRVTYSALEDSTIHVLDVISRNKYEKRSP